MRNSTFETLVPRWDGPIIVAAPGPSLTRDVAEVCRGYPTICIKQAAIRIPWGSVVYSCNDWQWRLWNGFPQFEGERWSCHHANDPKFDVAKEYKLRLVKGDGIRADTFSRDPSVVYYGNDSGFAAMGFAIHWLKRPGRIVMVGFDFKDEGSHRRYFNGSHPRNQSSGQYHQYAPHWEKAAQHLPEGVEVVNATVGSALTCFPMMDLEDALRR